MTFPAAKALRVTNLRSAINITTHVVCFITGKEIVEFHEKICIHSAGGHTIRAVCSEHFKSPHDLRLRACCCYKSNFLATVEGVGKFPNMVNGAAHMEDASNKNYELYRSVYFALLHGCLFRPLLPFVLVIVTSLIL